MQKADIFPLECSNYFCWIFYKLLDQDIDFYLKFLQIISNFFPLNFHLWCQYCLQWFLNKILTTLIPGQGTQTCTACPTSQPRSSPVLIRKRQSDWRKKFLKWLKDFWTNFNCNCIKMNLNNIFFRFCGNSDNWIKKFQQKLLNF